MGSGFSTWIALKSLVYICVCIVVVGVPSKEESKTIPLHPHHVHKPLPSFTWSYLPTCTMLSWSVFGELAHSLVNSASRLEAPRARGK